MVQVVWDPRSAHLFVRPTFHAVYVTCVKAWHTSFFYILVLVITSLLYVQFHPTLSFYFQNLAFVLFLMSDHYVFPAVHLLCTIFIFCLPFQVMHSNHSSISMHVIFLGGYSESSDICTCRLFCLYFIVHVDICCMCDSL